jgi:hypothetical protein
MIEKCSVIPPSLLGGIVNSAHLKAAQQRDHAIE